MFAGTRQAMFEPGAFTNTCGNCPAGTRRPTFKEHRIDQNR